MQDDTDKIQDDINKETLSLEENPLKEGDSILDQLTEIQKDELIKLVDTSWQTANDARVKWMNDRQEGLQLYWGIRRPKDFPFRNCANVSIPLIRTIMDTLHANIIGSIDDIKPSSIIPVGPEDVSKSRKIEKLLNWQFTTQVDYLDIIDKAVHSSLLYGIAPIKLRYVIEREGNKKIKDGISIEVLPPEKFLTPPDASNSDVNEMDYVIHEVMLSKSDLRKRIQAGMYDEISDEDIERSGENISKNGRHFDGFLENIRSIYSGVESENINPTNKQYLTVLEYYGSFDYNDDGINEPIMVSMLKDQRKILRVLKWPRRRPFVIFEFSYILNRAVGESVPEILKTIQQEVNTLWNQKNDAVTISNIPFFFFDPVSGFTPDEIKLAPGVGIPTNGPPSQAVYFPTMNTTHPEMYRELEDLFQYAERLLGAGANIQGITQPKRITATEIATIDRRSGIRFLIIFNRIRKGIKQLFKLALAYNKEYMPPEIQVRITGLDAHNPIFETIKKNDLEAEVDIQINGNSILDDQAEKSQNFQIYQIGMANPLIAKNETAIYEMTRDLLSKLGVKRIDAYIHKPEDQIPKSPQEEHNLFLQEEYTEPHLAEDIEEHLKAHLQLINSDNFKLLSKKGKMMLLRHYSDTLRMKEQMEQMQLVQKLQAVNSQIMLNQMAMAQGQPLPLGNIGNIDNPLNSRIPIGSPSGNGGIAGAGGPNA